MRPTMLFAVAHFPTLTGEFTQNKFRNTARYYLHGTGVRSYSPTKPPRFTRISPKKHHVRLPRFAVSYKKSWHYIHGTSSACRPDMPCSSEGSQVAVSPVRRKSGVRSMVVSSRRRRGRSGAVSCMVLLFMSVVGSTEGGLFKRRAKKVHHYTSNAGVGGKDKVKEDVAWLLEDTGDNGWIPVSDDGHVKVWKRSMPDSEFVAIKSSATLLASPQALFEILTPGDIEIVRQYNPLVESGNDLEVIDRDNKVSWSSTMGIWPCRPRDFVTHIRRATLDDGSVAIVNSATTHAKAPERPQYVRGEILHGVFHIKAAKGNKKHSEFTMVHHFNPGGNVPAWLMNWLAEGKPITFVRRLEEVAATWDQRALTVKNMPCKGRGFADKPCQFLLSATDELERQDGQRQAGALPPRSAREWLAAAAKIFFLTLTTVGLYRYGLSLVVRQKGQPLQAEEVSLASSAERKGSSGENGAPKEVGVARVAAVEKEGCVVVSPEMSINGEVTDGEASSSNDETNRDVPSKSNVDLSLKRDESYRGSEMDR